MRLFYGFGFNFDAPGAPKKNHGNSVPSCNLKNPSKESYNIGARPFRPTQEYAPGHNGIKKP